jgi:hypothetical protein
MGQKQQELEVRQRPEWKDISENRSVYKSNWAQWNSLVMGDGVLERHWESADGTIKTA